MAVLICNGGYLSLTPAPDIFLSASASDPNLYAGWPLIVDVTIMNTNRLDPQVPSASLVIAPQTLFGRIQSLLQSFRVLALRCNGLSNLLEQLPLQLSPWPGTVIVHANWQMSAAAVSALPSGTYQLIATMQVSNSAGWNGNSAVTSVFDHGRPEPTLTPDIAAEKAYRQTEFAINSGDVNTAVTTTQQLRLAQPDNPIAAAAAANVLVVAGYPEIAFLQASDALDTSIA